MTRRFLAALVMLAVSAAGCGMGVSGGSSIVRGSSGDGTAKRETSARHDDLDFLGYIPTGAVEARVVVTAGSITVRDRVGTAITAGDDFRMAGSVGVGYPVRPEARVYASIGKDWSELSISDYDFGTMLEAGVELWLSAPVKLFQQHGPFLRAAVRTTEVTRTSEDAQRLSGFFMSIGWRTGAMDFKRSR